MTDLNVALILRLVDRATGPARAVIDRVNRMSGGAFGRNAGIIDRGARQMGSALSDAAARSKTLLLAVSAYKGAMAGMGVALSSRPPRWSDSRSS